MSTESTDIRKQVEANRGALKKLQLLIPGLRGYRKLEDIRVSDELLRNQVANKLDRVRKNLEELRKKMTNSNDLTNLPNLASMISQVQQFSGEVRHAQQGYSGFAATISIDENKLNKLYEYDYEFVDSAVQLESQTSPSNLVYDPTSPSTVQTALVRVGEGLASSREKWSVRVEAVQNTLVK